MADLQPSTADLQRPSIPSMVDGLTPDQRKVLFCLLKSKSDKAVKVSKLSAYVSEHTACHRHDEQRLSTAIIRMTHIFVGSNNINLLHPGGQIGTRYHAGEDCASPEHISTKLLTITRSIFHKDDDILLDYLNENGKSIEPTWYVPILPMILVNGAEGTGTGYSTYIPNYNPRDIIANLRRLLNDEYTKPMHPWYRGFKGSIEKTNTEAGGEKYTVTGVIEAVDSTRLRITELPIHCWTMDYRDFLKSLTPDAKNSTKLSFIQEFMMNGHNEDVDFEVILSEENMNIAKKEGLENKFKLTSTIETSNMHLLDSDGNVQKYDTPEQILEEFFKVRLGIYEKRKIALLEKIEPDLRKLDNEVRFICGIVHGDIIVSNRKTAELLVELRRKNFDPFPKKLKAAKPGPAKRVNVNDYEYLLSMPISTLTEEKMQKLITEKDKLENEVEKLRQTTPRSLWLSDLDTLEKELDVLDRIDEEAAEEMRARREPYGRIGFGRRAAHMRPSKKTADKTQKVEHATSEIAGNAAEQMVVKRVAPRKKPAKMSTASVSDNQEERAWS